MTKQFLILSMILVGSISGASAQVRTSELGDADAKGLAQALIANPEQVKAMSEAGDEVTQVGVDRSSNPNGDYWVVIQRRVMAADGGPSQLLGGARLDIRQVTAGPLPGQSVQYKTKIRYIR